MEEILVRPVEDVLLNNKIFDVDSFGARARSYYRIHGFYSWGWRLALRECLAERGYELKTIDLGDVRKAEKILFFCMHNDGYFKTCVNHGLGERMVLAEFEFPLSFLYSTEEYRNQFGKTLTWEEDIVDNVRIFRMNRPNSWYREKIERIPFKNRKLSVMINQNKYINHPLELHSERRRAVLFFQESCPEQFDLYGGHWDRSFVRFVSKFLPFVSENGTARKIERSLKIGKVIKRFMGEPEFTTYRGWCVDKYQTMSKYRFCICYEDISGLNGAISAKIFDCLQAGCVPIYLGAKNITDHVPADTLVDKRKFTYPELLEYLESLEEAEYERFLYNIQDFLQSEKGKANFERDWAEMFCKVLLS